jgi:molecular chaperone DnaK
MAVPFKWMNPSTKPVSKDPVRVIGIDLGTTITMVTEVNWDPSSDEPPVVETVKIPQHLDQGGDFEQDLIPSVVAVKETSSGEEVLVGEGARRLKTVHSRFRRNKNIWWESKNEIGTRRLWPASPEGFKTPRDIASKILGFIYNDVENQDDRPVDRVVVTVPASFQVTQRQDTIDAAVEAGIELRPGDLLDEPVAAFLDFMVLDSEALLGDRENTRIMVVDFGGGTCDVALLSVRQTDDGLLEMSRRGVSRFHRVGGGDLDMAIANDVLLPKLLEENKMSPFEINFQMKRDVYLPTLAAMAEILKMNLSNKVRELKALGNFDPENLALEVKQPGQIVIEQPKNLDRPVVTLSEPRLTLGEMTKAVGEFLNPNQVEPIDTEYVGITSIFTPIRDVLRRLQWPKSHVDEILLVGGSSLYYLVADAIAKEFPEANVRTYSEPLDAQKCVGRGAAWQALLLASFGKSPLSPTMGEGLSITTNKGQKELVEQNAGLPYPSGSKKQQFADLSIPEDVKDEPLSLRLAFRSGDATLSSNSIQIKAPVAKGAPIELNFTIDENQRIDMEVTVDKDNSNQKFVLQLDNPLSVVANANADRDRILELEEKLVGKTPGEEPRIVKELAKLNRKLRGYERARQLLELLVADPLTSDQAKGSIHFDLAEICSDMLDVDSSINHYRAAIARNHDPARFNLAFKLDKMGEYEQALELIDAEILEDGEPWDYFLKAQILNAMKKKEESIAAGNKGIELLLPFSSGSDWTLTWAHSSVYRSENAEWIEEFETERKKRRENRKSVNGDDFEDSNKRDKHPDEKWPD